MKKLAIVTTHPVQYHSPLFRLLARHCELLVFYTWGEEGTKEKFDPDFKRVVAWDIPLLSDYPYRLIENVSKNPGSHHFGGIKNPDLIKQLIEFDPEAILVYGWAYQSHLKALRYFKGKKPVWFRGDSTLKNDAGGLRQWLRHLFLRWVYKHVDIAFYVGTDNKAYFERMGLTDNQLIFCPHAVDNLHFSSATTEDRKTFRNRYGISENQTLVLFCGKLESRKRPELLLKAFQKANLTDTALLFVGNGAMEEELKSMVDPASSSIHFVEFQNQSKMPVVYSSCDLFCLPSDNETWGLAVNEAMAAGKAIIVSDQVGCAADLVIPGKNGEVFRNGDLEDFSTKLHALMSDSKNLARMGSISSEVIRNWTVEKQTEVIIKTLEEEKHL